MLFADKHGGIPADYSHPVPPGGPVWEWELVGVAGVLVGLVLTIMWFIIPLVEAPPNSKKEWKELGVFFTIIFAICIPVGIGVLSIANIGQMAKNRVEVTSHFEEYYRVEIDDGHIPYYPDQTTEFTVLLNPKDDEGDRMEYHSMEDFFSPETWSDWEKEKMTVECTMSTKGEIYGPINCLDPETKKIVPLDPSPISKVS